VEAAERHPLEYPRHGESATGRRCGHCLHGLGDTESGCRSAGHANQFQQTTTRQHGCYFLLADGLALGSFAISAAMQWTSKISLSSRML
ncbi:MAG TPA: hypothetical protein PLZ45_08345, partial [Ferruginibacter sp.]|nr:hypothetical protein [Ferruginibacter sp.]